ncbi:MAG: serine hydrolase domain-containing protein [Bacteroidota bacterium]
MTHALHLRRLAAVAAVFAAASVSSQPIPLDSLVRAHAAEAGLPSLTVGIVAGGERWTASVGDADTAGTPAGPSTLYEIGSISKVLTALALADAVGRGEVTLETPLADLLGAEVGAHADGPIRLADLAAHTSGLPRLAANAFDGADMMDPYAAYGPDLLLAFLAEVEPASGPGAAYAYSNAGAGALGFALARRVETDYASLVRTRVLAPLGMDDTFVVVPEAERARLATPHGPGGAPVPRWTWTEPTVGAGGWRASVGDVLTLAEAALDPDATPLAEALRLSLVPRADAGGGMKVGLGWHLVPTPEGGRLAWHNGGTGGSASSMWTAPEAGVAVVALANRSTELDTFVVDLVRRLAAAE